MQQALINEFHQARHFALTNHANEVRWIYNRTVGGLIETFDDFYKEYVYVVLASGFSSRTAARLVPQILECDGNEERMLERFKNRVKCRSMAKVHATYTQNPHRWDQVRELMLMQCTDEERVNVLRNEFAYIGNITKWHLARNIGLVHGAKPDVHMVRYAGEHGYAQNEEGVMQLVDAIMQHENGLIEKFNSTRNRAILVAQHMQPTTKGSLGHLLTHGHSDLSDWHPACQTRGQVDFVLWLWLSHQGTSISNCCNGEFPLK